MESLREGVMVNQFVAISGCHHEQAKQFLQAASWHFETALSMFFQESTILPVCRNCNTSHPAGPYPLCTPANTPATPPNFSDALMQFSKLSTSTTDKQMGSSPRNAMYATPPPPVFGHEPSGGVSMGANSNGTTNNMIVPPATHLPHGISTTSPR